MRRIPPHRAFCPDWETHRGFPFCRPSPSSLRALREGRNDAPPPFSFPAGDNLAGNPDRRLLLPCARRRSASHRRLLRSFQVCSLHSSPPHPSHLSLSPRQDAGRRRTASAAPSHLPLCPLETRQVAYRAPVVPYSLVGVRRSAGRGANGPCGTSSPLWVIGKPTERSVALPVTPVPSPSLSSRG